MTPYPGRILVEPFPSESVLEAADNKFQNVGKVVEVGDGVHFVKPGDIIAYNPWGMDTVKYQDKEYFLLMDTVNFVLGKL